MLVADASRRTTALNAYVSGFGATRRIVVYDNLLKAPQPEVELVVAHELGHAGENDVLYGTLVGALGAALGAILLFLVFGPVRRRAGVTSIADWRAAGAILGLMTLATFLSGPAQNFVSRHIEARADAHALNLTRDPVTFAAMQKNAWQQPIFPTCRPMQWNMCSMPPIPRHRNGSRWPAPGRS
ncbi:M48 family metalloprotease [Nonomuraea ferruginea]